MRRNLFGLLFYPVKRAKCSIWDTLEKVNKITNGLYLWLIFNGKVTVKYYSMLSVSRFDIWCSEAFGSWKTRKKKHDGKCNIQHFFWGRTFYLQHKGTCFLPWLNPSWSKCELMKLPHLFLSDAPGESPSAELPDQGAPVPLRDRWTRPAETPSVCADRIRREHVSGFVIMTGFRSIMQIDML